MSSQKEKFPNLRTKNQRNKSTPPSVRHFMK